MTTWRTVVENHHPGRRRAAGRALVTASAGLPPARAAYYDVDSWPGTSHRNQRPLRNPPDALPRGWRPPCVLLVLTLGVFLEAHAHPPVHLDEHARNGEPNSALVRNAGPRVAIRKNCLSGTHINGEDSLWSDKRRRAPTYPLNWLLFLLPLENGRIPHRIPERIFRPGPLPGRPCSGTCFAASRAEAVRPR